MKSKLKEEVMDAVGELPDFGNLLLRESGYPHLDDTPKQSQSDAWNEAGTKPDHPCLCEVDHEDFTGYWFQYWNGDFWGSCATNEYDAEHKKSIRSDYQSPKWREVQP